MICLRREIVDFSTQTLKLLSRLKFAKLFNLLIATIDAGHHFEGIVLGCIDENVSSSTTDVMEKHLSQLDEIRLFVNFHSRRLGPYRTLIRRLIKCFRAARPVARAALSARGQSGKRNTCACQRILTKSENNEFTGLFISERNFEFGMHEQTDLVEL